MAETATETTTTTTATETTTAANSNWFSALPAEDIGYIQNKGFAEPDAAKAAVKIVQAYREFEKYRGIPQDRILALPTDGDEAATKAFWQRLGAPADPKEYEFAGIDFGDEATTNRFLDTFRASAAKLGMPKTMAAQFAADVFKTITDVGAAEDAAVAATLKGEREKLEEDWGPPDGDKFKANMLISDRAAAALGVPKEALEALRQVIGGTKVAQMFRDLGVKLGEAKYVLDPNNNQGSMTREQAVARRLELAGVDGNGNMVPGAGDAAWRAKLLAKDAATTREYQDLNRIISGR
jgi:hypothetical protein